jgi:hypothetical protein
MNANMSREKRKDALESCRDVRLSRAWQSMTISLFPLSLSPPSLLSCLSCLSSRLVLRALVRCSDVDQIECWSRTRLVSETGKMNLMLQCQLIKSPIICYSASEETPKLTKKTHLRHNWLKGPGNNWQRGLWLFVIIAFWKYPFWYRGPEKRIIDMAAVEHLSII